MRHFIAFLSLTLVLQGCVTSKLHKELQGKYQDCQDELAQLRAQKDELTNRSSELERLNKGLENEKSSLTADTASLGKRRRSLENDYRELNKSYDYLLANNNTMMAANARQNKEMLNQLQVLEQELQLKEDSLARERMRLDRLAADLDSRTARIGELEAMLQRKDSTMRYVRDRVADALKAFEGNGLTVTMKNGRVYVNLDNSLLFPSGKWEVQPRGKEAIDKLSAVLAQNKDLSVLVEGHTDNDPYRIPGQVTDNWDLSVMRATSIVKVITANKGVDPKRVTAAGRGEFVPLVPNTSAQNKAINRRTEIILTPDLGEIAKAIEEIQ
jgi:chemotaxis protein MotB